ncbi:MAG TPA: NUDIX domain-containing protein, partial [Kofleriaceae bacterium]|nr:NUDIX domain-containing protein [Kofleriaceae bacterium]
MSLTGRHAMAVSVDCLVFGYDEGQLRVLLIERRTPPFAGRWAIPGGFVEEGETLRQAAERELAEETSLGKVFLEQFQVFDAVGRDPRGRVLSVAFLALVKPSAGRLVASSDAARAAWFLLDELPDLAFDHRAILREGLDRLRADLLRRPIGLELLPRRFTLGQLQRLYEAVLNRAFDASNFRKKILGLGMLRPTADHET